MVICYSRVEIALVRPGIVGPTSNDASVKLNEERLAHFKFASLNKAKGKLLYAIIANFYMTFLEIKSLLLQFQILGEIIQDEGFESGCLSLELGAVICRAGCQICSLKSKVDHLKRICPNINDGPGSSYIIST